MSIVSFSASPVQSSYIIELRKLDERVSSVIDFQFLHGYHEPTVVLLYEPLPTWAGWAHTPPHSYGDEDDDSDREGDRDDAAAGDDEMMKCNVCVCALMMVVLLVVITTTTISLATKPRWEVFPLWKMHGAAW